MFEQVISPTTRESLDLAAMKIAAIADRGAKRDFIDLYILLQEGHIFSLKDALDMYDKKFGKLAQNKLHIVKSLGYFEEADKEAMPQMIKKVSWETVRKFLLQEQEKVAKQMF